MGADIVHKPMRRPGWEGEAPSIFDGRTTKPIFMLAYRPQGATIQEMLSVRRETRKSPEVRVKALIKLLNAIEDAYTVKLISTGDVYRFVLEK
jgi:hypothetical protein